ncbi:MAG: hypothetical protein AAF503_00335 [Pseudomonadota bacterium]
MRVLLNIVIGAANVLNGSVCSKEVIFSKQGNGGFGLNFKNTAHRDAAA